MDIGYLIIIESLFYIEVGHVPSSVETAHQFAPCKDEDYVVEREQQHDEINTELQKS